MQIDGDTIEKDQRSRVKRVFSDQEEQTYYYTAETAHSQV